MPRRSKPAPQAAQSGARDRAIAAALTAWFARAARQLPWRTDLAPVPHPRNPYHALVAEAMLQQTQVSRVIDYFHRFIARFPTVQALADAPEADVLAHWSGLGYYRRAKNLHAAAKAVVNDFGGKVPATAAELARLPGVGPYTAGAIASIVFDEAAPIVDGNVLRVLQRLDAREDFPSEKALREWAWSRAGEAVAAAVQEQHARGSGGPARFNEGLMELGATICLPPPARPNCLLCPLREHCQAFATGRVDEIPAPRKRAVQKQVWCLTLVIRRADGRFMMEQRGDDAMWAGMWQCPTLDLDREPMRQDAAAFAQIKSADVGALTELGAFTHNTTHRQIHFRVYAAPAVPCRRKSVAVRWVAEAEMGSLGISNAQRRVLNLAGAASGTLTP